MRILALCLAALCLASLAFAQSTNSGAIRGTVTDPSGAIIPGAKVTVLNLDTGVSNEYVINSAGLYDTVSILPGKYRVTFSKEGFNTLTRDGITLRVGAPLTVDGQLTVGTAQQSVQVIGEAPLMKTETAEQSSSLSADIIAELPNVGRDWTNMTKTLPGVVGSGGGITANGTMPYYANFLADGIADINPHSANVNYITFEAIAEVQINTSSFSALYGTGAVVFNQISKSGSNQWHGSAYEYAQNEKLNARSFFASSIPIKRYNNFGGSVAGPMVKNKAFFFFNFEKIINNSVSFGFNAFPTAQMKAGNFSDTSYFPVIYDPGTLSGTTRQPFGGNLIPAARMDRLALETQKYFPTPTLAGYTNNMNAARYNKSPYKKYFGRADYQISNSNRLALSVNQMDNPNYTDDPQCPLNCYNGDVDSYVVQLSDVWTITPALINELRLGYHREDSNYRQVNLGMGYPAKLGWTYSKADMFPAITISGTQGSPSGLNTSNNNARYAQNSYNPSDVVTWIRGKHILHFGGEVLLFKDNDTPWGNIQGDNFTFSGFYTAQAPNASRRVGYADYLLGQVQSYSSSNRPIMGNRQTQHQLFVQDDIKVRPNLTLNLGLRYQTMGGWREKHNNMGTFDPTITNPVTNTLGAMWFAPNNGRPALQKTIKDIILPRLGVAWTVGQNWVVRGGFGIFTQPWSQDWYASGASGLGAALVCSTSDSTQLTPKFLFSDSNPNLNCAQASRDPGGYNGQSVSFYPLRHSRRAELPVVAQRSAEIRRPGDGGGLRWQSRHKPSVLDQYRPGYG
ncbi:MAG: TonB-dependent receptor [Bryobacterales bacterium]|nr:TonB-dependent receptor [Bryobacterales bacterium]